MCARVPMSRSIIVLAAVALAGCAFSPSFGEGQVACAADGTCPPSYVCAADKRCYSQGGDGGCIPIRCPTNNCGQLGDGCGRVLNCGNSCPPSAPICGGGGPNVCGTSACTPKTQCLPTQTCGTIPDGCASTLSCGSCGNGQICGGDGTLNRCCTPVAICPSGANCGHAPDGCGGAIDCGSCIGGRVCGGGGVGANKCGARGTTCTAQSCAQQGKDCGSISDGCASVLNCGTCPSGKACVNNVCG
jgi:hypothetical protein